MTTSTPDAEFEITLEWCGPNFDAERRFARLEGERAKRETARYKAHPITGHMMAILFGQSHNTWKQYAHELVLYGHALDRHEDKLENGTIPFKVLVLNKGPRALKHIQATFTIEDGKFDYSMQSPARPTTPEGDKQRDRFAAKLSVPVIGGFARKNIRLDAHRISADFSRLESGQDAFLINQIVHIHAGNRAKLHYEVRASDMETPQTGVIKLS